MMASWNLGSRTSLVPSLSTRMVTPGTQTLTVTGQVQDLELHNLPHCRVKREEGLEDKGTATEERHVIEMSRPDLLLQGKLMQLRAFYVLDHSANHVHCLYSPCSVDKEVLGQIL